MLFKKLKRQLAFSLSLCMLLPLCACSGSPADTTAPTPKTEPAPTDEPAASTTDAPETEPPSPVIDAPAFVLDVSGKAYELNDKHTTVKVSLDAVNTVKKELFGDNISWRGEGYGIYDKDTDTFNSTLVEMVKKAGITTLRYPGGIEGDYFRWQETIGDDRVPQIDPFSKDYPTYASVNGVKYYPYFGWEEFMRLCEATETEAIVQLNAGTGTPKEAADLVRWCIDNGYPVSSYAIGNEVNFAEERVAGVRSTKTPEEYIAFSNEVYEQLGSLADDIELGILGLPYGHGLCRDAAWDRQVLSALGDKIDFIDCHLAYAPYFTSPSDTDTDIYKCYMASTTFIKDMIEREKDNIETYTKRADEIKIQITEYGPMGTYYNGTVGAVFLASLLQVMANEPMISSANHLPMLNHPAAANLIGYDPQGIREYYWDNVCTYVFRWYSAQAGRDVLAIDTDVPTFYSKKVGLIPAVSKAEMSNTAVYYDKESKCGTLFVINQSVDKNMVFDIQLPFEAVKITAISDLFSANPKQANGPQNPYRTIPKNITPEEGVFSGSFTVTSKPISVVKIDFEVVE
ncbi:MAG: hypothetical protein IJF74_05235 [Clostridia bacterium]|nr:hypothetical protein [Clostridia bacterium]